MSFIRISTTSGEPVEVETPDRPGIIGFTITGGGCSCSLTFKEFFRAVLYVLQNNDLEEDDPRREFVRQVQGMRLGKGYNRGEMRMIITT